MKRWLFAGELPFLAVLIIAAVAFVIGRGSVQPHDRVAVVEQGALVLEAVLSRPDASPEDLESQVRAPILQVLQKYADAGYTVLDVSRDDAGRMAVAALPAQSTDITAEMRAAMHLPPIAATAAASAAAPTAASTASPQVKEKARG
jgi:hypothetical protein